MDLSRTKKSLSVHGSLQFINQDYIIGLNIYSRIELNLKKCYNILNKMKKSNHIISKDDINTNINTIISILEMQLIKINARFIENESNCKMVFEQLKERNGFLNIYAVCSSNFMGI